MQALASLSVPDEFRRSHIAHGFGDVVRSADDESIRASALASLLSMQIDPADRVRYEVALALRRLARRGYDSEDVAGALHRLRDDPDESVRAAAT